MKRYIEVEAVKERLKGSPIFNHFGEDGLFIREAVLDIIEKFANDHSADVVEVVRCKDCKHFVFSKNRAMCGRRAMIVYGEWLGLTATDFEHFCSYGERREE